MKNILKLLLAFLSSLATCAIVPTPTLAAPGAGRYTADYTVPNVKLVRDDGKSVSFPEELNDGRPVVMNFVFTSCTTICPVLSQTFERLQDKLGKDRESVRLVSISIDPEQDTPERLTEFAKRYHAGKEWRHYTGTLQAIIATQRAFDVYRGDKMAHQPVTLVRVAPGKPWVRFEGFATADELLQVIRDRPMASN
jgi:protein SCO1/2